MIPTTELTTARRAGKTSQMKAATEKAVQADQNFDAPAAEETTEAKRNVATQIFVFYREKDTDAKGLTHFDFKGDLDKWLAATNVEVLTVIRGVEKKIKTQNKIFFA